MKIDDNLRAFATVRELEYIEAIEEHGSIKRASEKLGVTRGSIQGALRLLRTRAAFKGYAPEHNMTHTVPDGYVAKGVSTYFNKDGVPTGQWVKSSIDDERRMAILQAAADAMAEQVPRAEPAPGPAKAREDLATVYTLTDCHVGALAWREETGADWDLKIAEQTLVGCFAEMIAAAPPAALGVVAQLGDFLDFDGILPVTPTHGHVLDVDGRFTKVVQVAIRILRRVIGMALAKHSRVVVLLAEGNHDITSSIWLRTMFAALFENDPRVEVIQSPLPYYAVQHGQTMLCWHHGHLKKNDALPLVFASEFPAMWGSTKHRYAHTGHRHHKEIKEHSGMTVMQHQTLAARNAHAARGGYTSTAATSAITYHARHGQWAEHTVTPEMLD